MAVELIPGEFSAFTIAIAVLSGFIVFFGYVSMFLKERLFLSEAFVALVIGILSGPLVTNAINPYTWQDHDEITKQLTRCIIAIQVMAVGIELPKHYFKKEWLTMLMFLLPVMMFMWLISGMFIWALIPPISYLESLVIAACVCPTDPVLANSVVKGRFAEKHVPAHIRNALSAESGANDGMGFPFLFLAIFLIGEDTVGVAVGKWIYVTCLFQIVLSCVIGVVVGYLARKILQWSEKHHLIDKPSFLSFAIALALFLMSMTGFSGSDDVLACFVAGNAFSWDAWFRKETEEAHFQEVIDMMLNLAIFVYIGAIIPWSEFTNASIGLAPWRLVVLAIMILLFRRLPIVLLLKPAMPSIKTYREAAFSGWFGPMGVGAVFLSKIAKEELEHVYAGQPLPVSIQVINPVVLFIVLSSVLVHGTTIPLFKLGKRIRSRTLSITSIGSNASQVLHLPKFQHRRSEDDLLHHYHNQQKQPPSMTELQRNTLFNTIHRHWQEKTASGAPMPLDAKVIQMDLDDDLAEEDYLPNNDDNSMHAPPAHQPRVSVTLENDINDVPSLGYMRTVEEHTIHQDEKEKTKKDTSSENMDATLRVPTGMYSPPTIYLARHKTRRRGSSATIETQGIRFVEPIKPRNLSHTNLSTLSKSPQRHPHEHLQRQEEDENDPAHDTPSLMSWINKHSPLRRAPDLQKDKDASTAHDDDATTRHHSSQGLRHYFFKRAAPASAATPRAQEAQTPQTPQPPSILAPGVLEMQLSPPTVRQSRRSSEHTTKSTITVDHNERQPQL